MLDWPFQVSITIVMTRQVISSGGQDGAASVPEAAAEDWVASGGISRAAGLTTFYAFSRISAEIREFLYFNFNLIFIGHPAGDPSRRRSRALLPL